MALAENGFGREWLWPRMALAENGFGREWLWPRMALVANCVEYEMFMDSPHEIIEPLEEWREPREEWKVCPLFPQYQVSSLGRVRYKHGRLRKLTLMKNGYFVVGFRVSTDKTRPFYVHDLVTAAFVGPKPQGLIVNHKDAVKTNNRLGNLEYATYAENARHAVAHGCYDTPARKGSLRPGAKLTEQDIPVIRQLISQGVSGCEIGRRYGVHNSVISSVKRGLAWRHVKSVDQ